MVFRRNAADSADMARLFTWMGLPLALAIAGMVTTLSERIGPLWLSVGALFGFVVAAAWSLGLFYAYGALALLDGGDCPPCQRFARGGGCILAPLWFLAGVGALPAVFLVLNWARESACHHTVEAPSCGLGRLAVRYRQRDSSGHLRRCGVRSAPTRTMKR